MNASELKAGIVVMSNSPSAIYEILAIAGKAVDVARIAYIADGQERPYKNVDTYRWHASTLLLESWRVVAHNADNFRRRLAGGSPFVCGNCGSDFASERPHECA